MNVNLLSNEPNGVKHVEIRSKEISSNALVKLIRKIPNTEVMNCQLSFLSENLEMSIRYKNTLINLESPFSDYILSSKSTSDFDEFIDYLSKYNVRIWERWF